MTNEKESRFVGEYRVNGKPMEVTAEDRAAVDRANKRAAEILSNL